VLANACFGHTPLVVKPHDYARLLMEKIERHGVKCWLMNTGFSGEPHGSRCRVALSTSRALVDAAVSGKLEHVEFESDPVFQFEIPSSCPGLEAELLNPRALARDQGEYEMRAARLATDFMNDFSQFAKLVPERVKEMLAGITLLEDSLDLLDQFRITI
jgi:phosphoenolpyruvate carboxykinase (ATP)